MPIVSEIARTVEAVTHDPFIDDLHPRAVSRALLGNVRPIRSRSTDRRRRDPGLPAVRGTSPTRSGSPGRGHGPGVRELGFDERLGA